MSVPAAPAVKTFLETLDHPMKAEILAVRAAIPDPGRLLLWKSADRAIATFRDLSDVKAKETTFAAVVREWIAHVQ